MTEKCYGIYFDRFELEIDRDGNLANPEVLQIIEYEYDQDELIAVRRVDKNGEVIADQWTCSDDLRHVGWDDDETIEKAMGRHVPFFDLRAFHVDVAKSDSASPPSTIATVKVAVNGREELGAGEGAGPVDALNSALRLVLRRFYPALDAVVLQDYHVRILDPETATRAVTRVVIESTDGTHTWGTVGVSPNIIEASWQALVDSFEYKLLLDARSRA